MSKDMSDGPKKHKDLVIGKIKKNCCKITLEVLEGNTIAKNAYKKFGFMGYELDPKMGKAMLWEKSLV